MNDSVYKNILTFIKQNKILISQKEYNEECFGSWFIEINQNPKVQIIWDGKEGELSIRRSDGADWEDIWFQRKSEDKSVSELLARLKKELIDVVT